jgi:hypothetical protein
MKKLLLTIVVLAAFAITVSAQVPTYAPQAISPYQTITANTTTNYTTVTGPVLDVRHQQNVAIEVTLQNNAAGATNNNITLLKSVSGLYWDTTNTVVIQPWSNGTTACTTTTNIDVSGFGYLKLYSINNPHATANITNIVICYGIKTGAP